MSRVKQLRALMPENIKRGYLQETKQETLARDYGAATIMVARLKAEHRRNRWHAIGSAYFLLLMLGGGALALALLTFKLLLKTC